MKLSLMKLLKGEYLRNEIEELHKNNVVVNHIGDIQNYLTMSDELIKAHKTQNNNELLNWPLNYGGRQIPCY